ncbi:MAG: hypothetical protein PUC66_05195 [Erysipelotrichaceae bacterium]|nr:hypothetical protein [Erysipelotrichaceae bacterium]
MKYTLEFKLECIDKYKKGIHIDVPPNCKSSHRDFMNGVRNWAKTYDKLGTDGLKHSVFNRRWTAEERFKIVAQTLTGKPLIQAALENGVCTSQEKVDTSGTPFSRTPYLFCTMAGSLGLQYLSLYWAGVR